jgi:BolA protein
MSKLDALLRASFAPQHLEVRDESDGHSVPRGSESHARVLVVWSGFSGQRLLARHRMVNEAAAEVLASGLHAMAVEALTPEEWQARGGVIASSPACLGGSARGRDEVSVGSKEERS